QPGRQFPRSLARYAPRRILLPCPPCFCLCRSSDSLHPEITVIQSSGRAHRDLVHLLTYPLVQNRGSGNGARFPQSGRNHLALARVEGPEAEHWRILTEEGDPTVVTTLGSETNPDRKSTRLNSSHLGRSYA